MPDCHPRNIKKAEAHIILLGGEGPDANACSVGFHHTVHFADIVGRDAKASTDAPHRAIGGCHERIGTYGKR